MKTIRKITKEECSWLKNDIEAGTTVYPYYGPTYGAIGFGEIAVTLVEKNKTPFTAMPANSVDMNS